MIHSSGNQEKVEVLNIIKRLWAGPWHSRQKQLKFAGLGLLFLLLAAPVFFWNQTLKNQRLANQALIQEEKDRQAKIVNQQAARRQQEATSIATFFISTPFFASLKVYASWEGNYRIRDQGNSAQFDYIGDGTENSQRLMEIRYFTEAQWQEQAKALSADGWAEIKRQTGQVFVYKIWPADTDWPETNKFNIMRVDAAELIKSFRVFKNG